jgi:predicted nucleotidyltransferase
VSAADEPLLDRARIQDLFCRLGERLRRRGVVGDVYVIGGAAMALAYDARRATRDIDAVFLPHGIVLEEAHALAAELGLPQWWLNEQASAYVAPGGDPQAPLSFDHPGLRVSTASPEHLLAMKAMAARRRDIDDLRLLVGRLGLTTPEQVVAVCTRVFPDEPLPDRARLLLADLFEEMRRADEGDE